VLGRPSAIPRKEEDLLRRNAITHMVCRNSGGEARAKLIAARNLGMPVIMIHRPPRPEGEIFARLDDIVAAIG
jgi:precorrin-6A/cobalt-precorrin-6A reductase